MVDISGVESFGIGSCQQTWATEVAPQTFVRHANVPSPPGLNKSTVFFSRLRVTNFLKASQYQAYCHPPGGSYRYLCVVASDSCDSRGRDVAAESWRNSLVSRCHIDTVNINLGAEQWKGARTARS